MLVTILVITEAPILKGVVAWRSRLNVVDCRSPVEKSSKLGKSRASGLYLGWVNCVS